MIRFKSKFTLKFKFNYKFNSKFELKVKYKIKFKKPWEEKSGLGKKNVIWRKKKTWKNMVVDMNLVGSGVCTYSSMAYWAWRELEHILFLFLACPGHAYAPRH